MKILLLGDIHIGQNKNNPIFHDISLKYADWVINTIKDRNIDEIWQMGDLFHDRVSINIPSIDCSFKFMDKFKAYPFRMITGNHDSWFLHNSDVHSLSLFKNWTNVTVYDKPTKVGNWFFCPWGTTPDDIEVSDIVIGHFEITSFDMGKGKICSHGLKASDLMSKTNKILLSGHFHKPQVRRYDDKVLLYTGSGFQLDWGATGEDKFIYILDTDTFKIEKIKNTHSPRFEYIRSEEDFGKVYNNFVSIQVEDTEKGEKIITKILSLSPVNVKTQILEQDITVMSEEVQDFKVIDVREIIPEFIKNLENLSHDEHTTASKILLDIYDEVS